MPARLDQKVVLIVGGTGGLGQAAAAACIDEGANLVVVGRDAERCAEAERHYGRHRLRAHAGDACDPKTARDAVQLAVDAFGRLDGLYHVAGGSGRSLGDGPLHECSDEGWDATLQWNLTSLFYSNRAGTRQMLAQGTGGSIVNMTSVLGRYPACEYFATHAYAAAKAAVNGLVRAAAARYAPDGIRFNAVAPALVDTPMAQRAMSDHDIQAYVRKRQPLGGGRSGVPQDLNGTVVFLLSEDSAYATGQVLYVDGGWSVTG